MKCFSLYDDFNLGEVPNLFDAEELEKAIIATRPAAKEAGIDETNRDSIYQFFIGRVRNYLHLMLCMSPVGSAFRYLLLDKSI